MDLHPTPFPGKRRPAGNPTAKKERDQPKLAASVTESKPKRTFGRNLSGNVVIERHLQKNLAAKPWKPSGLSKNMQKPTKKPASALSGAAGAKSASNKKAHHVTFLETETARSPAVVEESVEISHDDLLVCTPVFFNETPMQETPYQSAENCSNCRLEKLETASYWISQIRVAELSGKHFVAAAFFRLALECRAQPFVALQNEIKHYRDRHGVVSMDSLWDDLCREYGFTSDQPGAVLVEQFDSKCSVKEEGNGFDDREMCKDYDLIDKPEDIVEDLEAENTESEKIVLAEHYADGILQLSSSMNSPLKNSQVVETPSSNSALRGGVRKPIKIVQKKANKAIRSSKNFGQDGAILGSSNQLKIKSTSEEQFISADLNENADFVEDRENEIYKQE